MVFVSFKIKTKNNSQSINYNIIQATVTLQTLGEVRELSGKALSLNY
ncbi:hypothetical protein NADRNF5_1538 [Nitrosopumilus adriaticus]|uniref:Uncharacterized protein n=1 Tax=Nitrosopumilus adriaticus TaxID=1580092 RepID=A0A0D5C331_9ARCH|nr:hypothetical protein NADRNF5_1538 [Nitrosopumilus adriaticus]